MKSTEAPDFATFLSIKISWTAEKESRPEVGSSRNTQLGLVTNSTPTIVLFRSPPDIPFSSSPPTNVSAHLSNPSSSSMLSTSRSISSSVVDRGKRNLAENLMHSLGVEAIERESSCATKAMLLRKLILVGLISWLLNRMSAPTVIRPLVVCLPERI